VDMIVEYSSLERGIVDWDDGKWNNQVAELGVSIIR
jgi:hypothetical protein